MVPTCNCPGTSMDLFVGALEVAETKSVFKVACRCLRDEACSCCCAPISSPHDVPPGSCGSGGRGCAMAAGARMGHPGRQHPALAATWEAQLARMMTKEMSCPWIPAVQLR